MITNQEKIKKIIFETIYSSEETKELLILKGGQSLNFYGFSDRASYDIDFTIAESFKEEFEKIEPILKVNLIESFEKENLFIIDYKFQAKPKVRKDNLPPYWGGYYLEFKVIEKSKVEEIDNKTKEMKELKDSMLSKQAIPFGKNDSTKVQLEFSYHEYSENPLEIEIEDSTISMRIYRPIIVVYEKIRALCQNVPGDHLPKNKRARSRDLYDIYSIIFSQSEYSLEEQEIYDKNNIHELRKVFACKEVPLNLLLALDESYETLKEDFLKQFILVVPEAESLGFDYLFNFTKYLMGECHSSLEETSKG